MKNVIQAAVLAMAAMTITSVAQADPACMTTAIQSGQLCAGNVKTVGKQILVESPYVKFTSLDILKVTSKDGNKSAGLYVCKSVGADKLVTVTDGYRIPMHYSAENAVVVDSQLNLTFGLKVLTDKSDSLLPLASVVCEK